MPSRAADGPRPRRVFLADVVPLTARAMFFYDLVSSPLTGVYVGVLALLPWIAKQTLGASDLEIAVLVAAPSAAHLLTVYWAHRMEGRPKMPWVVTPAALSRLCILCAAFALNSLMLTVLAVLAYLIGNVAAPALNGIWRNNYPSSHRYRAVGVVMTSIAAAALVTSLTAGWLLKTQGEGLFRSVFLVGGGCGILGVAVFSRIKVRGEGEMKDAETEWKPFSFAGNLAVLRRDRRFGKFMLLQFMLGFSNLMAGPALISLLKGQRADYLEASVVLSAAPSIVTVLTMPLWGRWLQGINPWRARSLQSLIWIVGFSLIAFSGAHLALVVAGQAVVGAALGGGNLLWSLQQMYFARKEDVPKYMGVHCTLTGVRGLIAPFVGVALMGVVGAHGVFFVALAGFVAAEAFALRMARREHLEAALRGNVDAGEGTSAG